MYQHNYDYMDAESKNQISVFTQELVAYWVSRGFDSDELIALGNRKSIEFLIQIAEKAPELDNAMFFVHIQAYLNCLSQVADFKLNRTNDITKQSSIQSAREKKQLARLSLTTGKQVVRLTKALAQMNLFKGTTDKNS